MLSTKNLVEISLFTALTIIGAYLSLPIGPVAISLQSLFIMIGAYFLKEKIALSAILYCLLGLLGLPVFTGGRGGISQIFSPSFGFIMAMIIFSYFLGKSLKTNAGFLSNLCKYLSFSFSLYLIGLPYMALILNLYLDKGLSLNYLLVNGMLLFIPGDIIKAFIAASIITKVKK